MDIIKIDKFNTDLLKLFLEPRAEISGYFRYFDTRNTETIIQNHLVTFVGMENGVPISYGHIDKQDDIFWLGICVHNSYQKKRYGTCMMYRLLSIAKKNKISVNLAVDKVNTVAQNIYIQCGFKQISSDSTKIFMKLDNDSNNTQITLPVSYGEAYDKLGILEIKIKNINDDRKHDVEREYSMLRERLYLIDEDIMFYYRILKETNSNIWKLQDEFRMMKGNRENLCIEIIEENDRRFRIKNKINNMFSSFFKEQKGYDRTKVLFLGHLGLGDNITCSPIVRFLSTKYDEVHVVCKEHNKYPLESLYGTDPSIKLYIVNNEADISINFGFEDSVFREKTKPYDKVIQVGYHSYKCRDFSDIPFCFYKELGLDKSIYQTYSHVPITKEAVSAYESVLKTGFNFILQQSTTSNGELFNVNHIEKLFDISRETTIIIDINKNVYNPHDKFFSICEQLKNMNLLSYTCLFNRAYKVILSDSALFCLVNMLPNRDGVYYMARNNTDYSHFCDFKKL